MHVLYQGLLRSPASWARVGRGYLKAWSNLGIEISAVSPRGFLYDPSFPIPPAVRELTPHEAHEQGAAADAGIGFLHPPRLDRLIGRRTANLFVWESNRVPPEWLAPLSEKVDRVVVPSLFTRDALVRSGFPETSVSVVRYGYDPELLQVGVPSEPVSGRPFRILSIVAPHYRKGVAELLAGFQHAFRSDDDVELWIKSTYDPGTLRRRQTFEIPSWSSLIESSAGATDDRPAVRLEVGPVRDDDIARCLGSADLLVQPSWGESFGLAILEAHAAGLPAVVTGWGGHVEFVPPGDDQLPFRLVEEERGLYMPVEGAVVAHPDIDALAARLRWHYEHRDRSRELGQKAREHVSHLTWERSARELLDVMRRV